MFNYIFFHLCKEGCLKKSYQSEVSMGLKSVHFKKPVTRSSFLSKSVVIFNITTTNMITLFERNEDPVTGVLKWTDFRSFLQIIICQLGFTTVNNRIKQLPNKFETHLRVYSSSSNVIKSTPSPQLNLLQILVTWIVAFHFDKSQISNPFEANSRVPNSPNTNMKLNNPDY